MTAKEYIKKNWNLPNALTLMRLFLVPVYLILFSKGLKWWALGAFLLASLTDLLDGKIARKYNLVTDFGKLADPIADKIMVLTALLSMTIGNDKIPPVIPWLITGIVLAKEVMLVVGASQIVKRGVVVHSLFIGKAATVVFIVGLVSTYFHDELAALCPGWFLTPDLMLLWLAVILAVGALITYAIHGVQAVKNGQWK